MLEDPTTEVRTGEEPSITPEEVEELLDKANDDANVYYERD